MRLKWINAKLADSLPKLFLVPLASHGFELLQKVGSAFLSSGVLEASRFP